MDRMACVDLEALPLQRLLRRHPAWATHPVAVVDHDRPQGVILWTNARARARGIRKGMRYAGGLALSSALRAAEVSEREIAEAVASVGARLRGFTPHVEPSTDEPGIFWLDASGLELLYGSLAKWAGLILTDLRGAGYEASVVVGFSRFGTYAVARETRGARLLESPEEELALARKVKLERLFFEAGERDILVKLGIKTVGEFIDLPADGIARRFGKAMQRLHGLASARLSVPFQPERPSPPPEGGMGLDHAETDLARVMAVIGRLLPALLVSLRGRGQALCELRIRLSFEDTEDRTEALSPAAPTLEAGQILELVRLRLEHGAPLKGGIVKVVLEAEGKTMTSAQLALFAEKPRRSLEACNQALARLRAELGDGAVRRAALREGHLPEGSFLWEPMKCVKAPRPRRIDEGNLIRRFFLKPEKLPSRKQGAPDGWMLRNKARGRPVKSTGPFIVSGGWWRKAAHRDYYFVETDQGELLWVFYDRLRRNWYLHGRVE